MDPARKPTLYAQLEALPERLTGEILNGQLHAQPRPSGPHAIAESSLTAELNLPFQKGRGGPGGWWIVAQPEIHFVRDSEVAVPDVAGWKRERMPVPPQDHRFEVIPDWVCEILSPSTASKDREIKMPLYAHYGVPFAWLATSLDSQGTWGNVAPSPRGGACRFCCDETYIKVKGRWDSMCRAVD